MRLCCVRLQQRSTGITGITGITGSRVEQTKVAQTLISPCKLTSLLVQHDQSPDAGIFTLTDRQKENGKEDSEEET